MDDASRQSNTLSRRAQIWGTLFLVFQILFALNSYGPHRIPGLRLLFDEPWVETLHEHSERGTSAVRFAAADSTELASFERAPFHETDPRYLEVMGGGVAVGDYDGDGTDDLFFTSLPSFADSGRASSSTLFRNRGDGTFIDVTTRAGLDSIEGYPQGALFFDADNDGDQDLYVAAYGGGQLFQNDDGQFADVTNAAGLDLSGKCGALPCFASSATAADYNHDGLLDLLIVNNVKWDLDDPSHRGPDRLFPAFFTPQPALLFRNNGDGTFTDVSDESGITNEGGKGLSATWLDANDDGWQDLYIANDLTRNKLYVNQQDGTFREMAVGAGVDEIKSSMGVAAGDVNHDGRLDLAATNLKGSKVSLFLNRSQDPPLYAYATDSTGLGGSRRASGWGLQLVDFNLDGHLDLVTSGGPIWKEKAPDTTETRNLFFKNNGEGHFTDVTATIGAPRADQVSRGLAVMDANGNGRPDLVFTNLDGGSPLLLLNQTQAEHGWLKVRLRGVTSNRDGVGARVVVHRTDSLRMTREVRAGESYQSTSSKDLFFGLGSEEAARMTVRWPSGVVDTLRTLPSNQTVTVREGRGRSRASPAPSRAPATNRPE